MNSVIDDLLEREPQDRVAQDLAALWAGKWSPPDDSQEPVFLVRDGKDAALLRSILDIAGRRDRNEISEMYFRSWCFVVEGDHRARLLSKTLTRDSFIGAPRWRPVPSPSTSARAASTFCLSSTL